MEYKSEIINFEKEDAESKKRMLGSDKVNIEEIKQDVIKAIECDKETMPDYYYDMDMGNHIKTLASDIEYLLSIIEQQEKTMSLFANNFNWNTRDYKGETVYEWGLPSKPMELAEEALQAIRKGD